MLSPYRRSVTIIFTIIQVPSGCKGHHELRQSGTILSLWPFLQSLLDSQALGPWNQRMKWFPKSSEDVDVNAPCTLPLRAPWAERPALAGFSTTYALSLTCLTRTSTKCICSQLPAQVFRLVLKTSRHRDTSTVNSTCTSHTLLPVSRKDGERVEILAPNQFQPIAEVRPALLTYHQALASQTL